MRRAGNAGSSHSFHMNHDATDRLGAYTDMFMMSW
jgi:hypothetical protein